VAGKENEIEVFSGSRSNWIDCARHVELDIAARPANNQQDKPRFEAVRVLIPLGTRSDLYGSYVDPLRENLFSSL